MKKTLLTLGVIAVACQSIANATVVNFGAIPTARTVVDSSLATVSTNGLVWVGTFGNESFAFNPALSVAANVAAMTTAGVWHQFGLDTSTNTPNAGTSNTIGIVSSPAGKVGGAATDNTFGATKADFFNSKPLYLWIFNAATPETSTEMGIFRAPSGATPAWNFATNGGGVGDSVSYSTASSAAPTMAAIGGAGSTNSTQMILSPSVPEPSALTLASLAALGVIARRPKRKNA